MLGGLISEEARMSRECAEAGHAMDGFVFDLKARRVHKGDKEILAGLAECAAALGGRGFSMREYREWMSDVGCRISEPGGKSRRGVGKRKARKPAGASTILRRFGGWRRAQWLAGVGRYGRTKFSAEELMEILERVWRELGRAPGDAKLRELGGTSMHPYRRRWGSVRAACERLAAFHAGKISREEMLRRKTGQVRRPLKVAVRWRVLMRDGFRCVACGKSGHEEGVKLEVDHIRPVARGGSDAMRNLRALCLECNRGRGCEAA
jgi:5-methylcytosine-specific restriction endonuclease McrA